MCAWKRFLACWYVMNSRMPWWFQPACFSNHFDPHPSPQHRMLYMSQENTNRWFKGCSQIIFFTYNFMPQIVMDIWGQSSRLNVVMQRYVPAISILDAALLCTDGIHFGTLGTCNCTLHCKVPAWNHISLLVWMLYNKADKIIGRLHCFWSTTHGTGL